MGIHMATWILTIRRLREKGEDSLLLHIAFCLKPKHRQPFPEEKDKVLENTDNSGWKLVIILIEAVQV